MERSPIAACLSAYAMHQARSRGLGGGVGDNTCEGGDSGSDGEGIWGSGEDHGENGDDGGVDIARSLATSASDQAGIGTGAGI
ncbi:hypothetical protein Tco_1238376 [Tanacetum coccineum]